MKPTTTIRIDSIDKEEANKIFEELGINLSTAINAFLKVVIREGKIPFELSVKKKMKTPQNSLLNKAFINKKDEFYTLYEDIEKEINNHISQFYGKTVMCNCDNPFTSAFFEYFVKNFNILKLSKLISTCYATSSLEINEDSNVPYKATITNVPNNLIIDENYDVKKLFNTTGNSLERLKGNGDFRSEECVELLKKSEIIVTNPPFSMFREYLNLLIKYNKKFLIIGNINSVTCKDIFPLFRDNMVWFGDSIKTGDRKFYVPSNYPLDAAGCGIDSEGRSYIRVKGVRWFTNLDSENRNKELALTQLFDSKVYPKYENYNAIDVDKTKKIPKDYNGIMGVPITFLDKYCPSQFEILMLANGNARTNTPSKILDKIGYKEHYEDRGGVGIINGERVYARIMIKRK